MKYSKVNFVALLVLFPIILFSQNNTEVKLETVDSVNLEKYVGTWYEISKIPNSFQDQCIKNTTANYKINNDGEIIVLNKCIDE
ncbi:MAG: lipocalin family protein, partial [Ignavibacteriae bacterium]|nr:lipocalin family protein [Ignavibacteriota bacterium]